MPSKLKKIEFDYRSMKAEELFFNKKLELLNEGMKHEVVSKVLGRDLMFGEFSDNRPYIYNSLVVSIDGRIYYSDSPQGPLVARNNQFAGAGSSLDYWILNLLRGSADAILVGTKSISAEVSSGGTGHCYDENLEIRREERGKNPIPWRIVVTKDGTDVVFEAEQFKNLDMSTFFYTTVKGVELIKQKSLKPVIVVGPFENVEEVKIDDFIYNSEFAYIIVAGEGVEFNHKIGLKILKEIGVDTLLVESPTIAHIFMEEQVMDELFLNQSGVYIGGNSGMIGQHCDSFTSVKHPHTEIISIHMHSPHFTYFRYKLLY